MELEAHASRVPCPASLLDTSDLIGVPPMIATGTLLRQGFAGQAVALPIYLLYECWPQRKPVSQIRQKIKPIKPNLTLFKPKKWQRHRQLVGPYPSFTPQTSCLTPYAFCL